MKIIWTLNLGASVTTKKSLQCSIDDQISLVTTKCIYIYDCIPDMGSKVNSFSLALKTLVPTDEVNPWQSDVHFDRSVIVVQDVSPREQSIVLMDKAVSPGMECGKSFFRSFVKTGWISPPFSNYSTKYRSTSSRLLTLSSDHWLRVYAQRLSNGQWECIEDLSEIVSKLCKTNSSWFDKESSPVLKLQSRAYAQATMAFVWIESLRFLVTVQKNGMIIIWKQSPDFEILKTIFTSVKIPNFLDFYSLDKNKSVLLMVSGIEGVVKSFLLNDSMNCEDLGFGLWSEKDRLRVSDIRLFKTGNDLGVILAKERFLILGQIQMTDNSLSMKVRHDFDLGPTSIVQIVPDGPNSFILGTTNDAFKTVKVLEDGSVNIEELNSSESLDTSKYSCRGFFKQNGLFGVLQSLTAYHDHLVIRTLTKLTFFSDFENGPEALENLISEETELSKFSLEITRFLCKRDEIPVESSGYKFRISREKSRLRFLLATMSNDEIELQDSIKSLLNNRQIDNIKPEVSFACPLCDGRIQEDRVNHVVCEEFHSWPVCVLSSKPAIEPTLLKCRWCHSVALKEENINLLKPCSLCLGPFDFY